MNDNSGMFRLNIKDIAKGLVTAVFSAVAVAVLGFLHQLFLTPDFDFFAACWSCIGSELLSLSISVAGASFIGYIGKNFFSNSGGKFLGKIG